MEVAGYGELSAVKTGGAVVVRFGSVETSGENYDLALIRLASALLDHPILSGPFLVRMRDPAESPPAVHLRNDLTVRTAAGQPKTSRLVPHRD